MTSTLARDIPTLRSEIRRIAVAIVSAILVVMVGYVALAIPAAWFPRQDSIAWRANQLALVRGTGTLVEDELVVTASSADGSVLVSFESDIRTDQYPGFAWVA